MSVSLSWKWRAFSQQPQRPRQGRWTQVNIPFTIIQCLLGIFTTCCCDHSFRLTARFPLCKKALHASGETRYLLPNSPGKCASVHTCFQLDSNVLHRTPNCVCGLVAICSRSPTWAWGSHSIVNVSRRVRTGTDVGTAYELPDCGRSWLNRLLLRNGSVLRNCSITKKAVPRRVPGFHPLAASSQSWQFPFHQLTDRFSNGSTWRRIEKKLSKRRLV